MVRRVLVIGGPGSGKTTLAAQLAADLGVDAVHLDRAIAHRPPSGGDATTPLRDGIRVPDEERRAQATAAAARPSWVAEGVYAGWTEPLRDAADLIVWLDLPGHVAALGVAQRQLGLLRTRSGDRYDVGGFVRLLRRAAWGYRRGPVATAAALRARDGANSSATVEAFLAASEAKVVRCRTRRDVARLRSELVGDGSVRG